MTTRKQDKKKTRPAPGVEPLEGGGWHLVATLRVAGKKKFARDNLPSGTSLGQAIDRRNEMVEELRAQWGVTRDGPPSLKSFSKSWIRRLASEGAAKSTLKNAAYRLSFLLVEAEGLRVDQVDFHLLEQVKRSIEGNPDLSRSTGTTIWSTIKRFVRRAWVEFNVAPSVDIFLVVRTPRCKGGRQTDKRALTMEELEVVLANLEHNVERARPGQGRQRRLEAEVLFGTGLRIGELCSLRWDDLDPEAGALVVREHHDKTRRGRRVMIASGVVILLTDWRREMIQTQHAGLASGLIFPSPETGRQRPPSGMSNILKTASTGIKAQEDGTAIEVSVHAHTLRRTYNRTALEAGVNEADLQGQLGHSSGEMTRVYRGTRDSDKKQVAGAVWDQRKAPVVAPGGSK